MLAALVAGCQDGPRTTTARTPSASPVTAVTPSPSASPTPSAAPAALAYRTKESTEQRGQVKLTLSLPVFSGPLAQEVNRRVSRSVEDGIGRTDDVTEKTDIEVLGVVSTNDGRTVQVQLGFSFFEEGSAHPTDTSSTVVLTADTARPVLLTEVLSPLRPALAAALRHASEVTTAEGGEDPAQMLKPVLDDWADWQSGPKGMTFYFDDYQAGSHAGGIREADVPWTVLRPWVTPAAWALLGP